MLITSSNMVFSPRQLDMFSNKLSFLQQPIITFSVQDDFTYLCRICAVKTQNIIQMFGKNDDDQNLVEKINKYLPIKVNIQILAYRSFILYIRNVIVLNLI